jgi:hypothetical protein
MNLLLSLRDYLVNEGGPIVMFMLNGLIVVALAGLGGVVLARLRHSKVGSLVATIALVWCFGRRAMPWTSAAAIR